MIRREDFFYHLPEELIAQDPLSNRLDSRLLVLDRKSGIFLHEQFHRLIDYLHPGDCLVLNDTKVIPARLIGKKEKTGSVIELLLLKKNADGTWETLVRPGKKARAGTRIVFGEGMLTGEIMNVAKEGNRIVKFTYEGIFEEILDQLGQMPLPPYITHELEDKNRYQTVYAEKSGSAAAPTAGLHFTSEFLEEIGNKGIGMAKITLHVGLGTFRPVRTDIITDHKMHEEYYEISEEAAEIINRTKRRGGRVFCVGTTSCRTVEAASDDSGVLKACSGWTDIFIYPGYEFRILDGLITNFHLPESTLLMLVSALAGREKILEAYQAAIDDKYRFFSFGDAMLIL